MLNYPRFHAHLNSSANIASEHVWPAIQAHPNLYKRFAH